MDTNVGRSNSRISYPGIHLQQNSASLNVDLQRIEKTISASLNLDFQKNFVAASIFCKSTFRLAENVCKATAYTHTP